MMSSRNELAQGIFEQHREAMLVVDPQTLRIAEANIAACDRLGYERDALLKLAVTDVESSVQDVFFWDDAPPPPPPSRWRRA